MNKIVATFAAVMLCLFAYGQQVSPYSRFGVGDVSEQNFAASRSLGGLNAAYRSTINLNYNNPASFSDLAYTSLETGVRFNASSLQTGDTTFSSGDGFIDYVVLGFPLTPHKRGRFRVGSSAGLVPYSQMNYNQQQDVVDSANNLEYSRLFNGTGRLYNLYFGTGAQLLSKDTLTHSISFGLSAGYRFGKMSYGEVLSINNTTGVFGSRKNTTLRMNDLVIKTGVQYKLLLNSSNMKKTDVEGEAASLLQILENQDKKRLYLVLGAYASLPANFNVKMTELYDRFLTSGGSVITVDTASIVDGGKVNLGMPAILGFGATLMDNRKWTAGIDLKYSMWSGFNSGVNNEQLKDAIRIGVGIELTPNIAQRSVVKRTSYRLGGYYDTGYLNLNGQQIAQYGITFGFGLPVTKNKEALFSGSSYINVALELGSRGTTTNNLIRESFFGGTVGIVLNDRWFQKSKYD